ncbi:uncharacterized protein LOC111984266 [Quercus suber]|uniref:uncharacterized protein LOC111984266 n=1 Tax=Quercus suber TaxID=58331 RepID=UPI000CE25762|nr:uncharacterized protein LOC111984266 [Quercus suber]
MYLAVFEHAVSAILLKDQGGVQKPIYYISKTLVDAETRYLPLGKLALALVHARKLPHYFQAHTVYVLTEYPLQSLLKRSDFMGSIAKWGTRLGSFDIRYMPRNSVKGQVLVDFITKFTPCEGGQAIVCNAEAWPCKVFVDCMSNAMEAGVGIVIVSLEGVKVEHSLRLGFKASNNEAEYEALLVGLRARLSPKAADLEIYFESWLVNKHADSLATLASTLADEIPQLIKVEVVQEPSIDLKVNISVISLLEPSWMDPIIEFLAEDRLPSESKEANRVRRSAALFWLSKDHRLYLRSFVETYLLCLYPSKVNALVTELHEGWWLDIVSQFPQAIGNKRFVLVAIDYFTKWVESKALANIRDMDVKKFVWKNIVTRFGIPESLISDNGLQFDNKSNGQAEATNKTIVSGLKKRLEGVKGKWTKELPNVLWAYQTTSRRSTGETLYSLTYGVKAIIPLEISLSSTRTLDFSPGTNSELMYDKGIKAREFGAGDLMLQKAVGSAQDINVGKLAPNWEGQYRLTAIAGVGAYHLEDIEDMSLP